LNDEDTISEIMMTARDQWFKSSVNLQPLKDMKFLFTCCKLAL